MPRPDMTHSGFTLIEIIVALLLIAVTLLALEGGGAVMLRQMSDSDRESLAVQLVQARAERVLSTPCGNSAGVDSVNGVVTTWSASAGSGVVQMNQTAGYQTAVGLHTESYRVMGACQ